MQNFAKPKNFGNMKNPDGVGEVGNIVCGDVMFLYIKVDKKTDKISDVTFQTYGCVAAIATSSIITKIAKGKALYDALKIEKEDVVRALGGLPKIKVHCSVLAVDALVEAIHDYLTKNKQEIPEFLNDKHIRLQKEKKDIEERYKDWIDTEKKLR
jgi:nitrogen fixation NifU-like protein